jgi:O-antigen/teichoic acid export membrane protein
VEAERVEAEVVIEGEALPSEEARAGRKTQAHDIAVAVRNTLKLGSSLLITWGVAMIVRLHFLPLHLGPVRQGYFGFAESFAAMFFTTLHLGVDTYVMKEVSIRPKHASDFIGGIFALRVLLSVVLLGAMVVTLRLTGRSTEIQLTVVVFGLCQLLTSINGTLAAILQAATNVGRLAVVNVATKFLWGAGLLLGLHYDVPLYLLALPILVSEMLRTAVLVPTTRRATELQYLIDVAAVWTVVATALPFFVSNVAIGLGQNLAMSVLGFMRRDEREVGWFAATQNLATLAMLLSPLLFWVVMPMLSRAHARSKDEMMSIIRRAVDGLVIMIAPLTIFISVASDVLVKVVFGEKYAPAATGLSILSLVFAVTYINMMLSCALVVSGKSWSVTVISLGAIVTMGGFMLVFIPLGRALFHVGGECAGAAMAVIGSEIGVVIALLSRFGRFPLDKRNIEVCGKTIGLGIVILVADRLLRGIGTVRLAVDAVLYAALALGLGVVKIDEIKRVVAVVRARRSEDAAVVPESP